MVSNSRTDADGFNFIIRISCDRAAQLKRLARDFEQDPSEVARKLLETEIEAQHGLRHGPYLRKFMYR